jgi:two-component system NtrC family sensor kinase
MESHMIQASKLAAVGELASGVAHEINNPLASVAGYAEEMLDLINEKQSFGNKDLYEFKEGLNTIIEQALRCKEITQSLLNFSRQGQYQLIPTDLNNLIEKTLFLVEPDIRLGRIKVIKNFDPDLPFAETDPSQLQQVFLNVLKNALDAVDQGGIVRILTRSEDGFIRIQFKDNGAGIPEMNLKKVFNPFFTTKPTGKGTGLGLSICYSIMEKLKGKIEVESQVVTGTTFTIKIPAKREIAKPERLP